MRKILNSNTFQAGINSTGIRKIKKQVFEKAVVNIGIEVIISVLIL
jgi:hypothetical protein